MSGRLRSRRSNSGSSALGSTPKARAMRPRLPVTLPTSSCRFGTDRAEQHRLGVAFEDSRDVGEVGRFAYGLEVVAQILHEAAQPEAVEIRQWRRLVCVCLLDDAHFHNTCWPFLARRTIAESIASIISAGQLATACRLG